MPVRKARLIDGYEFFKCVDLKFSMRKRGIVEKKGNKETLRMVNGYEQRRCGLLYYIVNLN